MWTMHVQCQWQNALTWWDADKSVWSSRWWDEQGQKVLCRTTSDSRKQKVTVIQFSQSLNRNSVKLFGFSHVTMTIITEITSVTTNTDDEVQASVKRILTNMNATMSDTVTGPVSWKHSTEISTKPNNTWHRNRAGFSVLLSWYLAWFKHCCRQSSLRGWTEEQAAK